MPQQLMLALAQLNPIVGDITGNAAKLMSAWREAQKRNANILITSETFLTGYCPDDFILKPRIHKVIRECVEALARDTASGPAILLGTPWFENGRLYNAALLLQGGKIQQQIYKSMLPSYGPFDDKRLFDEGPAPKAISFEGCKLGVMLCEDMWYPEVPALLRQDGAQVYIVLNGSPFYTGRQQKRYDIARARIQETGLPLIYINQVGGQDELVYEGSSFAMSSSGDLRVLGRAWSEDMLFVTLTPYNDKLEPNPIPFIEAPGGEEAVYHAALTGLRDYVLKNGFGRVVLGLSGGIDSAVVATMAVDALGADNVQAIMMPSPYTSPDSIEDAKEIAKKLGCRYDVIPINEAMDVFDHLLAEQFMGCEPDTTEENIQARCRGILLMAVSNKSGAMLLSTGNKSELAVGYATLYGDMCGGYAPLKDVYKTGVYKLAQWRNEHKPMLARGPEGQMFSKRLLEKAPSAELKEGQRDDDTLPPYPVLDNILHCLIEQDMGVAETCMMGHDALVIRKVALMIERAEFKRRQGPPGPKVTRKHLTKDRRYPITNRYGDKWRTQQTD